MSVSVISEAVTMAEAVAAMEEAMVPVDLAMVSSQLGRMLGLLEAVHFGQMTLCGVILGVGIILVLAVMFRG